MPVVWDIVFSHFVRARVKVRVGSIMNTDLDDSGCRGFHWIVWLQGYVLTWGPLKSWI